MKTLALRSIALLLALGSAGCLPTAPEEREALWQARWRWESRHPAAYEYTIQRFCECLGELTHPIRVTVQDSEIRSAVDLATRTAVQPDDPRVIGIGRLFDLAGAEIRGEAHAVDVRFDPEFGYPTSITVDMIHPMVDDEIAYSVRDFRMLR